MHQLQEVKLRSHKMLVQLLPDQISKFWDVIKFAVEQSLPPTVGERPGRMNRILSAALSGRIDVWASYVKEENSNRLEGIMLTKFLYDDASDTRNLLIYCIYGYDRVSSSTWTHGLKTLVKYAKSKGCAQIVAYTSLPYLVKLTKRLGGKADYTFLSFDVNKIVQKLNGL